MVAARLPPEPQVSRSPSLPFATGVHPGRVAPSPSTSSSQTPDGMSTFSCMLVSRCLTSWCLVGSLVLFHD